MIIPSSTPEKYKGDDYLSGFEKKLWSLQQHIIFKWGVYTIFRFNRMHVPQMKDQLIEWFVPADATMSFEIVKFVENELSNENRAAELGPDPWPGSSVKVVVQTFSCVEPYVTKEESAKMAVEMMKILRGVMVKRGKRERDSQNNQGRPETPPAVV